VDYITKPFQHEEVLARVTTHLHLRDLTQRLEEAKESLERRVEKRTAALTQANKDLQAEIAERRRAEAALKHERTLIANIMETSPVGITMVSREGQVTFANSQAEQVLGLSKDEITHRAYNAPAWRITDFAGGPFPDEKLPFRQVMATRQPVYDVQHAIEWPDGRRVFLSINGAPILDKSGEVESVVFALEDITERKRTEEALRESEERYRVVADNTYDWEFWISPDGQFLYNSPSCQRITGHMAEEFAREPSLLNRIIHPEDRERFMLHHQQTMETRVSGEIEFRILLEDGRVHYVGHVCQPVFDEQGVHLGKRGSNRDITERKHAEVALRDSEERLRLTMEAANIGSWDWDVENDIWYASPIYYTMLGYEPKAGPADRDEWLERVHPDDRDYVAGKIQGVLTRDFKEHRYEARLRHTDGTYRWQYVRGFEMKRDEQGKVTRMLGIRMDITERKQAEEKIQKLNQELEQRVIQRTAQLEATNKELEAFTYSVSHDLRAPLRHINGFLELLRERLAANLDDHSRHYMDTISDSAKHMGQLIDDLLAFSRMGRNELSKTPVDLGVLVQEIIRELAPETQDRSINWRIADLPTVNGDRAMLRLVLTNLISNALKFSRERSQADIEIGCQVGEKETIVFIRDNGVGFDMAYADKLFGVFQRLHRVEEFEGTGIGLATVRRIIQRHGGRTWAEGKINQGATFFFSLPHPIQEV
jgi:PAS domain S-box-containing protein